MKLKNLFLSMLFVATAASAQSIDVNIKDPETGAREIITRNRKGKDFTVDDSVAKTGLAFFSVGYKSTVTQGKTVETYFIDLDMFHNNNKLGCIKQSEDNVELTLEDGTKITCFQISDTECHFESFKAAFALTSKNGSLEEMKKNFIKLQTVAIKKIVVSTSEGALVYKIKVGTKDYIKAHFALLAKTINPSLK